MLSMIFIKDLSTRSATLGKFGMTIRAIKGICISAPFSHLSNRSFHVVLWVFIVTLLTLQHHIYSELRASPYTF